MADSIDDRSALQLRSYSDTILVCAMSPEGYGGHDATRLCSKSLSDLDLGRTVDPHQLVELSAKLRE